MAKCYVVKRRLPLAMQNGWTFFVIGSTRLHLTMEDAAVTVRERERFFRNMGGESFELLFQVPEEKMEKGDHWLTPVEQEQFLAIYAQTPLPFMSAL